jgi:hypothetical protein
MHTLAAQLSNRPPANARSALKTWRRQIVWAIAGIKSGSEAVLNASALDEEKGVERSVVTGNCGRIPFASACSFRSSLRILRAYIRSDQRTHEFFPRSVIGLSPTTLPTRAAYPASIVFSSGARSQSSIRCLCSKVMNCNYDPYSPESDD